MAGGIVVPLSFQVFATEVTRKGPSGGLTCQLRHLTCLRPVRACINEKRPEISGLLYIIFRGHLYLVPVPLTSPFIFRTIVGVSALEVTVMAFLMGPTRFVSYFT